jgi:hypothetical protein
MTLKYQADGSHHILNSVEGIIIIIAGCPKRYMSLSMKTKEITIERQE